MKQKNRDFKIIWYQELDKINHFSNKIASEKNKSIILYLNSNSLPLVIGLQILYFNNLLPIDVNVKLITSNKLFIDELEFNEQLFGKIFNS